MATIPHPAEGFLLSGEKLAAHAGGPPSKPARGRHPLLRRALVLATCYFFIRSFVGEAALVPTSSMEGTILVGDHILMNKLMYGPQVPFTSWRLPFFREVQRKDIIAFSYPRDPSLTFLKRVAAVGGDRVEIREDTLYVNDTPIREPYVQYDRRRWRRHPENMPARIIPRGHLFVLGDNRDNSDDSRYWGAVPLRNVIGEPMMVYWSYDAPSSSWLENNPTRQLGFYGSILTNFVAGTRWSRTGFLL